MSMAKQKMQEIIGSRPDDVFCSNIIRELVFERMISKGLKDAREELFISNEEMRHRIGKFEG